MTDFLEVLPPSKSDERDEFLAVIEITVLAIIFILAVMGNIFILYAIMEQKRFRPLSRIYYLIAHLSIADLLVALFNILPQLVWDITFRFKGGDPLCRFIKFMQVFVLYLSTYVLVAMSLDRYFAVIGTRSHWKSSPTLSKILVILAWSISIIFALPQIFIFSFHEVKQDVFDCWATFPGFLNQKTYVTWFVISALGIPLIIISTCHGAICFKIWSYKYYNIGSSRSRNETSVKFQNTVLTTSANNESILPSVVLGPSLAKIENTCGNCRSSIASEGMEPVRDSVSSLVSAAKMKTIKLTTIIVVCFVVCWSPFCVTQLYLTYFPPKSDSDIGPFPTIFLLLASLNSCCNPWIYLAFSGSLMNHLKKLLFKNGSSCCDRDGTDSGNSQSLRGPNRIVEWTRKQSHKDDSIGALDDECDEGHFIEMDQLKRETRGGTSAVHTDIKKMHHSEPHKMVEHVQESNERTHRPSDPLLTTSTKITGI